MGVDAGQLLGIKAAGRLADAVKVEQLDCLFAAKDFLVAVAPAQTQKVVEQPLWQEAHVAIGLNTQRAVTLAELRAVVAVDQGDMGKDR